MLARHAAAFSIAGPPGDRAARPRALLACGLRAAARADRADCRRMGQKSGVTTREAPRQRGGGAGRPERAPRVRQRANRIATRPRALVEGLAAQTRRLFANVDAILAAAGCTNADLVAVTLKFIDLSFFREVDAIYIRWLPPPSDVASADDHRLSSSRPCQAARWSSSTRWPPSRQAARKHAQPARSRPWIARPMAKRVPSPSAVRHVQHPASRPTTASSRRRGGPPGASSFPSRHVPRTIGSSTKPCRSSTARTCAAS